MNVVMISMGIAVILAIGLVASLGGLSLLSGTMEFFFGGPKIELLKTTLGETGLAFGFKWNDEKEPAKYDQVKVRLFNPFGEPTQVEISKQFPPQGRTFAVDLDFGVGLQTFLKAKGFETALIQIEVSSTKTGICHQQDIKGKAFLKKLKTAQLTKSEFEEKYQEVKKKPFYFQNKKSFIADPVKGADKKSKMRSV